MQQEAAMVPRLDADLISIGARAIHRIVNGGGLTIECVSGALWITQQADQRDVTLTEGEQFRLDRDGLAIVYGLEPATFSLTGVAKGRPRAARPEALPQSRAA
jgi:Protein of unknown function (DUF2917)